MTQLHKDVKKGLVDLGENQIWLCGQVTQRTGLYMDPRYLWRLLNGKRRSANALRAIKEVLNLQ